MNNNEKRAIAVVLSCKGHYLCSSSLEFIKSVCFVTTTDNYYSFVFTFIVHSQGQYVNMLNILKQVGLYLFSCEYFIESF